MNKILFTLTPLLVLSAHSAFGGPALNPDVMNSFSLMEAGKAKQAASVLLSVGQNAQGTITKLSTKIASGAPLSKQEVSALRQSLTDAADTSSATGVLIQTFPEPQPETAQTQQAAAQKIQAAKNAYKAAAIAAQQAINGDCAGYFAYGIGTDVSSLASTPTAKLSPQQTKAAYESYQNAGGIFLLTEKAVAACSSFLMSSRTPAQASSPSVAAKGSAQSPAQDINGHLAQVRPALDNVSKPDPSNPSCQAAFRHILTADAVAQAGYRALSDTFRTQGQMTTGLLNEFALTLDAASGIPTMFQAYTDACTPTVPETAASQSDAVKMEKQTEKTFYKNGLIAELTDQGQCEQAIIREGGFRPPPAGSYETAGQRGLSPEQGKAMARSNEADSQSAAVRSDLVDGCKSWMLDNLKPSK